MPTAVRSALCLQERCLSRCLTSRRRKSASLRAALTAWAVQMGEAADYRDNVPLQCLHPVGHWFEIHNMLKTECWPAPVHEPAT